MKSTRQRRTEIKQERVRKRLKKDKAAVLAEARRRAQRGEPSVAVGASMLSWNGDFPDFAPQGYYVDRPFQCKDCGKNDVWTATQQKWWYEVAKGSRYVVRVRCTPCGRAFQQRRIKDREQASRKRADSKN